MKFAVVSSIFVALKLLVAVYPSGRYAIPMLSPQQPPAMIAPVQPAVANLSQSALTLHQQLAQLQAQAHRFMQAPNGAAANLTANGAKIASNMLEALSSVGKAIQQQISNVAAPQLQVLTPGGAGLAPILESANSKKNEYQSIVVPATGDSLTAAPFNPQVANVSSSSLSAINYREQGEQLRQEIVRRAGQLQSVVASSMDALKNNGDMIVRKLLEQLNGRLDQARSKADKIINEPTTNEVGLRALATINSGLNNLNNIITNIANRLDIGGKDINGNPIQRLQQSQQPGGLLDPQKIKSNLQQLHSQFTSALNQQRQQQQQQVQSQQNPLGAAMASVLQQQQQQQASQLNVVAKRQ